MTPSISATSRVLGGLGGLAPLGFLVLSALFFVVVRGAMESSWQVQG
ncbi:hypothetical protein [Sorangium sp. So ce124]